MPSDEYKPLLDRARAIEQAQPLIAAAAPLLRELVNHASLAFRRCTAASNALGGENEDLAPFVLYRHTMELVDGIETLFSASCVDASVPLLRAALEASLSLDYIMKTDYVRRSLSWTCGHVHGRIRAHQQLDLNTDQGRSFGAARQRELGDDQPPWKAYDSTAPVASLQQVLQRPTMQPIEAEYQRLKSLRRQRPEWYQLFGGPRDRRALAKAVDREWEYLAVYGEWSNFSHAADATAYVRAGESAGEAAFLAVRTPHQMPHRAFLAARIMLRSTRVMIDHFRHGENLSAWYQREIREPWLALGRLHVIMREN